MGGTGSAAQELLARLARLVEPVLVAVTVGALAAGGIAWLAGLRQVADGCWIAGTAVAVAPAVVWVLAALRRGWVGVDLIAVLSLIGTLLVGEYLAGALIAVMLAGGRAWRRRPSAAHPMICARCSNMRRGLPAASSGRWRA